VTGTRDLDERGVREGDADRLALAAVDTVIPERAAMAQFDGQPARQCGQVPSLKVNGATTKSPSSRSVTAEPTSVTRR